MELLNYSNLEIRFFLKLCVKLVNNRQAAFFSPKLILPWFVIRDSGDDFWVPDILTFSFNYYAFLLHHF